MNKMKVMYFISTGLLSAMMMMSAGMYLFKNADIAQTFGTLGFPTWVIYPLATAKILGIIAIWTRFNKSIVEFAYAGFLYNFLLAFGAHVAISDGEQFGAVIALALLGTSYFSGKKYLSE